MTYHLALNMDNELEDLRKRLTKIEQAISIEPGRVVINRPTHIRGFTNINGITIFSGNGSPEGVITANIGSVYLRLNGGSGSTLYVKESGTGNTGWSTTA